MNRRRIAAAWAVAVTATVVLLSFAPGCANYKDRLDECRDGGGLCAPDASAGGGSGGGSGGLGGGAGGGGGGSGCPAPSTRCGDTCRDLSVDPMHCGSCDRACATGQACFGGECVNEDCQGIDCPGGSVCINDGCFDRDCVTISCGQGTTCVDGGCVTRTCNGATCTEGQACVEGACVDVNCQGVVCDGGFCVAGRCDGRLPCSNGLKDPGESDVDCGGSCRPCGLDKACLINADCTSMTCQGGRCSAACAVGSTCGTNPGSPCRVGFTFCSDGGVANCFDGLNAEDGITCGTDSICVGGVCTLCQAGMSCQTNNDPCADGRVACAGRPSCENGSKVDAGESCGAGQVCTASGQCVGCAEGAACTGNPSSPCRTGVVSCAGGVTRCIDGPNATNGITCGVDKVCSDGSCLSCSAGEVCASNPGKPCKLGVSRCAPTIGCDDGTNAPAGTACGTGQVCNGNGSCVACTQGAACSTNSGAPCKLGVTDCSSGSPQCLDSVAAPPGTGCGTDKVCNNGLCLSCVAGGSCATNPSQCRFGVLSCATGTQTCVDGLNKPTTAACGSSQFCDGNGFCGPCTAGRSCTGNPGVCRTGLTSCAGATTTCNDNGDVAAGTSCGTNQVCNGSGGCVACSSGAACTTNSNKCRQGVISCTSGAPVCTDGPLLPAGTVCGTNQVCDPGGVCVACTENASCQPSGNACKLGVTQCGSGAAVCAETGNRPGGYPCGSNQVCNGSGTCVGCTAGSSCSGNSNPCANGTTSCDTGSTVCTNGSFKAPGTVCGANQVCNTAGVCATCVAGQSCTTNPDSCRLGTTSCATGSQTCVDGAPKPAGTSCGVNQVCDPGAVCRPCTSGSACTGNPAQCRLGVTSCTSGTPNCVDGSMTRDAGTSCGAGQVCDNSGNCGACSPGNACTTNPNPCFNGVTDCSSGTTQCINGTPKAVGASCGTNAVCSASQSCVACTAGMVCTTNPTSCRTGIISCSSGGPQCVDDANKSPGTSCGINQVCNGTGGCVPCAAGSGCSDNPGLCKNGVVACDTGAVRCVDGSNKLAGASCGTNQVCNGTGQCTTCFQGSSCPANPNACANGVTDCTMGFPNCIDGAARPPGTSCGTNQVCAADAGCTACTAGAACTTNPNSCKNGTTSCSTGAQACIDGSNKLAGTGCGAGQVCDGNGSCGACNAGASCTTNPNPCFTGRINCSSGAAVCENNLAKPAGTSCGTNLVCSPSQTCVSCTAGQACSTNPNAVCMNGVISCSTGGPVCNDSTPKTPGTPCGSSLVCNPSGQCIACSAGQSCTTNPNACKDGSNQCSTGVPVCADTTTNRPVGTSCGAMGRTCDLNGTCGSPCLTPWGATVNHGQTVTAYQAASVTCGTACASEIRQCTDGVLSGTYTAQTCSVANTGKAVGQACSLACDCASNRCLTFYQDDDSDGFGKSATAQVCATSSTSPPPGFSTNRNDCCDADADAFPGQTKYFATPRNKCGGYDYDCDFTDSPEFGGFEGCTATTGCSRNGRAFDCMDVGKFSPGFGAQSPTFPLHYVATTPPKCGETATFVSDCGVVREAACLLRDYCVFKTELRSQACR